MADADATEIDVIVPLVPTLTQKAAKKCSGVRLYREPGDGMLERVQPETTLEDLKARWGGGMYRCQALGEDQAIIGQCTHRIAGSPKPVPKDEQLSDDEKWAKWFSRDDFAGLGRDGEREQGDRTFAYMEQRSVREAEDHRRALERQELERKSERERAEEQHRRDLERIRAEQQIAEKKLDAEMQKIKLQMENEERRRKEDLAIERDRADREDKRRREETQDRLREMEAARKADIDRLEKMQAAEKASAREFFQAMLAQQTAAGKEAREFQATLLQANKKDDGMEKFLAAVKFGTDLVPQVPAGGDGVVGPAMSVIATMAQEAIRERREKRLEKLRHSWGPQKKSPGKPSPSPGMKPATVVVEPKSKPTSTPTGSTVSAAADSQASAPRAGLPGLGGPVTPMAQMAIVAAVKTFSPETLVAMIFDLYEEGQVTDQTFAALKTLSEGEAVRRFLIWVNSQELVPHKDKLYQVAQLMKRELSDDAAPNQEQAADQELAEILSAPADSATGEQAPAAPAPTASAVPTT